MCGINGFFSSAVSQPAAILESRVRRMADALRHRGPDDAGAWVDADVGIALGHRRLSILDLSPAGHQPMLSASGRYVIAFNGEVYNHLELRATLAAEGRAPAWRGHSDTETLLAGFSAWGVEPTLQRCVGMFAIALWNRKSRTLTLARDRFGEKPLYYGWVGHGAARTFVFGSELKALRAHPDFSAPVCRQALAQFLRFNYVPAPLSIYEGIRKLEPGCLLTVQVGPREDVRIQRWWSLPAVVERARSNPVTDPVVAVQQLEQRLGDAVRLQSLADVPLGAFLSGGVDSSAIVALMQQQASRPVKTFTIGFDEAGFDEAPYALAVARHLGTEHYEMRVTSRMTLDVVPELPAMYDEPFADSSQVPTHLVCKAARQHVTVALSGDAGDELFGGYNRYLWGPRLWGQVAWLPFPLRRALGRAIATVPAAGWDVLGRSAGMPQLGNKAGKFAHQLATVHSINDLYWSLVTEWNDPRLLVKGLATAARLDDESCRALDAALPADLDAVERMMLRDSLTYLPDDILCKVDRAAMSASLETRVPFLDHRVVELAWQLPVHLKVQGHTGKQVLRELLYKHVPRELIERPKAGFAIPVGQWLRGPLRDWAEALLDEARLEREGYLHTAPVREAWRQHLAGHDNTARLWSVLMWQAWLEQNAC